MKRKRKLKNEDVLLDDLYRPAHNISDKLFMVGLLITALFLFGKGLERLSAFSVPLPQTTQPPAQVAPVNLGVPRARDARLVLSNMQGEILRSDAGYWFTSTGLSGNDVTARLDMLAFTSSSTLTIRHGKGSQSVDFGPMFTLSRATWSPDAKVLAVVATHRGGDAVYRVDMETFRKTLLLDGLNIGAPPIYNPATGRILIVERTGLRMTTLSTIAPHCDGPDSCRATRRALATVSQRIEWADYHPNATVIVFSDADDGDLYLLATATGSVSPLLSDSTFKRRPAFSPDGRRVAYLGGDQRVYILQLDDMTLQVVEEASILALDWLE